MHCEPYHYDAKIVRKFKNRSATKKEQINSATFSEVYREMFQEFNITARTNGETEKKLNGFPQYKDL